MGAPERELLTGGGQGKWDVRVADFVVKDGVPALTNVHVVRPANGHWYETQWWAPDGSPDSCTPRPAATAVDPELFFCRLIDDDSACQVTQLTATRRGMSRRCSRPDMKDVIFMSSRDQPGLFNTWSQAAQTLGLPTDYDYLLILPLFEAGFLQPVGQEYDRALYELDRATELRSMAADDDGQDGWITPEFSWDPKNKFLMWTENRFPDGYRYQLSGARLGPARAGSGGQSTQPERHRRRRSEWRRGRPLPVQQRTKVGSFAGSGCTL